MKNLFSKWHRILLIIILLAIMGMHKGKLLNIDLFPAKDHKAKITGFGLEELQKIFPNATSYKSKKDSIHVFANAQKIGWALNSSPLADSIVGFSSSTPVLIGFDTANIVLGVQLLENAESADFIEDIIKSGFMESWNNLSIQEVPTAPIDAVSGASESTDALIGTVRHRTAKLLNQTLVKNDAFDYLAYLKAILGILLLAFAILLFFMPIKFQKFRTAFQLMTVIVLGFWFGNFLSATSIYNWTVYGLDFSAKLFIGSILILSILLPLVTGKAFYCKYLCPYGACQDLLGKLWKQKVSMPFKLKVFLSNLREKVFAVLIILLLTGVSFDLTSVEPFSAFLFHTASLPVIILAVVFLLLSIFIRRPWCNYVCPTGQFLEIFKKTIKH